VGYPSKRVIEEWVRDHPWISAFQLLVWFCIVVVFLWMCVGDCLHGH
jgi:hypothetical protein